MRRIPILLVLASPLLAQSSIDVRVASAGAGADGDLAVRIYAPGEGGWRSQGQGGAAVVIPGGSEPGTLDLDGTTRAIVREGLAVVKFLFPGGAWIDPSTGTAYSSDGTYDDRGLDSIRAARDVVRYALGLTRDTSGRFVTDRLPQLRTSDVGILALSNGGNLAWQTMSRFGASMPGLAFYAGWENPSGGQACVGDLGVRRADPDPTTDGDGNGIADDEGTNPHYLGYGPREFAIDFSNLAYDPAATTVVNGVAYLGLAYHDADADSVADLPSDQDGSGTIDAWEDFPLTGYVHDFGAGSRLVYSLPVRRALDAAGIAVSADVATLAQTRAFWAERELVQAFPGAAANFPALLSIAVLSRTDHVQAAHEADGHLHVQHLVDGLGRFGLWHRVNPDRAYVAQLYARAGAVLPGGIVDNPAGVPVALGSLHAMAEPSASRSTYVIAAAVLELADRARSGVRAPNLPGLLYPAAP